MSYADFPAKEKSLEGVLRDLYERVDQQARRMRAAGGGGTTTYAPVAGLIQPYGGGSIPSGWLLCDGTAVPRAAYPELFAVIGTSWGAGDGSTTFNLPNLKGRTVIGRDAAQAEFDTLGETGGSKTHLHSVVGTAWAKINWEAAGRVWLDRGVAPTWTPDVQTTSATVAPLTAGSTPTTGGVEMIGNTGDGSSLDPYGVANWIISTGAAAGGGGTAVPALPAPWSYAMNGNVNVDGAAATWTDIDAGAQVTFTLADPMWVMVEMSAQITGATSTYGMIGVQATGALALEPEADPFTGLTGKFGFTAYSETSGNGGKTLTAHKPLLLPAGTTTLKMRKRRNVTTGIPVAAYPTIIVTPIAWVGAPGAIADDTGWVDISGLLVNGFTAVAGNVEIRRIGQEVEIRGSMQAPATAASSSNIDFITALPAIWRPTKRIAFGVAINNGYVPTAYARTDGTIAISLRDGLAAGTTQFTIKYFLG